MKNRFLVSLFVAVLAGSTIWYLGFKNSEVSLFPESNLAAISYVYTGAGYSSYNAAIPASNSSIVKGISNYSTYPLCTSKFQLEAIKFDVASSTGVAKMIKLEADSLKKVMDAAQKKVTDKDALILMSKNAVAKASTTLVASTLNYEAVNKKYKAASSTLVTPKELSSLFQSAEAMKKTMNSDKTALNTAVLAYNKLKSERIPLQIALEIAQAKFKEKDAKRIAAEAYSNKIKASSQRINALKTKCLGIEDAKIVDPITKDNQCNNNIDEDRDGFLDCKDYECQEAQVCKDLARGIGVVGGSGGGTGDTSGNNNGNGNSSGNGNSGAGSTGGSGNAGGTGGGSNVDMTDCERASFPGKTFTDQNEKDLYTSTHGLNCNAWACINDPVCVVKRDEANPDEIDPKNLECAESYSELQRLERLIQTYEQALTNALADNDLSDSDAQIAYDLVKARNDWSEVNAKTYPACNGYLR